MSALQKLRLRKACEAKLATLPLPTPFSIDGLVENISRQRGQRIRLLPFEERQDISRACGLRARFGDNVTIILYRPRPTQSQTEHIILHEIAHEWLQHSTTLTAGELRQLLPVEQLDQLTRRYGGLTALQARARYGTKEEKEAELGAYLIEQRISGRGPDGDQLVDLLGHALSHPVAPPPTEG
ncbi:hypothetical protein ABZ569_32270 [Streptomyces albus]|uniref:hypothetical protein n=1 Tax=Streptomyces albus TaxID=1888 RepID=UPI0033FBB294